MGFTCLDQTININFVMQDSNREFCHESKGNGGGAIPPVKGVAPASTSSTAENSGGEKKERQSQRKTRRCWSPELHRRFLQALQQLGGSHGIYIFPIQLSYYILV